MAAVDHCTAENRVFVSDWTLRTPNSPPPLLRTPLARSAGWQPGWETKQQWQQWQHSRQDNRYQERNQLDMQRKEPTRSLDLETLLHNDHHGPTSSFKPNGPIRRKDTEAPRKYHNSLPYGMRDPLSSRQGLDVSRFAFGSILRDYVSTSATNPEALGKILDRFLDYDFATQKPIVRAPQFIWFGLSYHHLYSFFFCFIEYTQSQI